jgi:hypothetical protein
VFGGLNRPLAVAAVAAGVLLAVPSPALACNSGVSAVNVYKECLPGGGGGKPTSGGGTSGGTHQTGAGSNGSTGPASTAVSSQTTKALKKAGDDGKSLSRLVRGYGSARLLQSSGSAPAGEPTAVGSAFDLGSGPTALLIVLAGTAVLLLAASGFRGVRQRRR